MPFLLKLHNSRKLLIYLSRLNGLGNKLANHIYWKIFRPYQVKAYLKNAASPSIEITSHIGCKNMCSFCPQDGLIQANKKIRQQADNKHPHKDTKRLTLDLFNKFLKQIPENYAINFAGYAEPWLAPDCTKMVKTAYKRGHKIRAFTTFVGMSPEDVKQLHKIPFEIFSVHLADATPTTKIKVDDKMLETVKAVNTYGFHQLEYHNHIGEPHPAFKPLIAGFQIKTVNTVSRASDNNPQSELPTVKRRKGKIRCGFDPKSEDLHWNVLLPNGDVTLCCEDYGLTHILGNLHDDDLTSMYQKEPYLSIKKGLDDDSMDILCRNCHRAVEIPD